MQEVMQDYSIGKTIEADTLEDLIPEIKKSLENPNVLYVKVFNLNNGKAKAEEKLDEMRHLLSQVKEDT